ncbi:hypothetical protein PC115_g20225 [Phytophthora cactorum]|uniref:DDE-1 domain-containing protein n=1 Tax=Phytophthora cactorum TaxID=29920 RepID=A0A8T1AVS5_9STRA|nr:hypothetical protein PC115_g20225 [Phytophthora cactorum]
MMKWIEEVWTPTADGCRMLMLDSLRVHKMESVKQHLEDTCCTKVQYVPLGITGLSQLTDVSVMRSFESNIQDLYREWHRDHELSKKANQRRLLLSHIIVGPRDANGIFRTYLLPLPQDAVVDK